MCKGHADENNGLKTAIKALYLHGQFEFWLL